MAWKVLGVQNEQQQPEESWEQYRNRNIAQTAANVLTFARSGAGLGDVLNLVGRTTAKGAKEAGFPIPEIAQKISSNVARVLLPNQEGAREDVGSLRRLALRARGLQPNEEDVAYYTQPRPNDVSPTIVNALAYKALGIPFGTTAAVHAGGHVGGKVTGAAANALTQDAETQELAREWGELGGGLLAAGAKHAFENRATSKGVREKVSKSEHEAFEIDKSERIKTAQAEYDSKISEINDEYKARIDKLASEYNSALADQERAKATRAAEAEEKGNKTVAERKAIEEKEAFKLSEEREKFQKSREEKIKAAQSELDAYDQRIKEINEPRQPNYNEAKRLESKNTIDTTGIQDAVTEAGRDSTKGLGETEKSTLYALLNDMETHLKSGKFPTETAKKFQKAINERIYKERPSTTLTNIYSLVRNALNEYINAANTPEHNAVWNAAEKATQQIGDLKKARPEFKNKKQREIQFAKQEKFSPIEEVRLRREAAEAKQNLAEAKKSHEGAVKEIESEHAVNKKAREVEHAAELKRIEAERASESKALAAEHNKIIETVGKETFEKMRESKVAQQKLTSSLEDVIDSYKSNPGAVSKWGLAGLGTALGWFFGGYQSAAIGGTLGTAIKTISDFGARELNATRSVLNNNRPIFNETINIIRDATVKSSPAIIGRINRVGKKIEELKPKSKWKVLGVTERTN